MTNTDLRTGRFTASVLDLSITPRHRVARPPVVYCHGVNGNAAQPVESTLPGALSVLRALSRRGYPIVAPTLNALWDNATGQARINDALTWARANLGASNAPAILVGTSHGGGSALHYAATNPTLVSCVVVMVPALDWQALRVSNVLNLRASIDTAWGVVYPDALPVGANPAERTAALAGKPIQMWTASDDPVSENHATFAAALGMKVTSYSVGALGHSEAAVIAVNPDTVAAFVQANGG